ncbi:uncharacterized protein LOC129910371 [Episyrphus balteatus]|uniref:uncharacterized protein LOC129910371 n=1 Tax=Episyrphus balteatus TaxID=286459 RepID=UPI002485F942|nr:uncharacterized protein LOC129910371 [Episyrphus balteatus]
MILKVICIFALIASVYGEFDESLDQVRPEDELSESEFKEFKAQINQAFDFYVRNNKDSRIPDENNDDKPILDNNDDEQIERRKRACNTVQVHAKSGRVISVRRC